MAGKFAKISKLEWVTLLLTTCFAAGTLLWFHFGPPPGAVTFTGTGEPTAAEQQAEQNHGRKLRHGSIDHLANGHNEEDLREHRAAQMDVSEQRNAEAHHVATQRRHSAIGALKRNGKRRSG